MSASIGRPVVVRFKEALRLLLGLDVPERDTARLTTVLAARAAAVGVAPAAYVASLSAASAVGVDEIGALADALTVPESHFFRYPAQFRSFARWIDERPATRVLSAGSAGGEEAYTIGIIAAEKRRLGAARRADVLGVDVSPAAVARARLGRYSAWSLRETPADLRERYFAGDSGAYVLSKEARAGVRFETRNLADATAPLGDDASFDAVFLRNVAIYWDVDATRRLVARLARLLRQNGRLYLGHAETLRGLSDAFDVRSEDGAYFYVKRTSATPRDAGRYDVPRGDVPAARPIDDRSAPGAWFEEIGRSAVRVAEIAAAADSGAAAGDDATPGLDKAVVRAAALVCEGRIDEAEETCAQALKDDPSNADAHYVLALCRERRGDAKAALDFDATAAKLDPRFAMPRLHMGMLARREGDFSAARRELRAAARLLQDEHPSRLEAFGGDFGREALAALCVAAAAEAESA